jgi:hypothetical protein
MFSELSQVMDHAIDDDSYLESLNENVANKRTKVNKDKTTGFIKQLYDFKPTNAPFAGFKYFWQTSSNEDKPLLALLFAIGRDQLLAESLPVLLSCFPGYKVTIESLEENIRINHPMQYSPNTCKSLAQNIASSWKQAGYITGKVKNIRTKTNPTYPVVAFALFLSYLNGDRGDFILSSLWVKALDLNEARLRELIIEAMKLDLLHYQHSGAVTTISFEHLINKTGIHGIEG